MRNKSIIIDLFVKQLNYTFNLHKITKLRVKSLNYERFCQNARIYGHARINTSDFFTLGEPLSLLAPENVTISDTQKKIVYNVG